MRRRATSGEMARGRLVFVFSLEVALVSEGDSFTRPGVVRHACRHRVTARGVGRCRGGGALIKTPKPPLGGFGNCRIETGTTNICGCERSYFRSALIRSDFRPAPNRSASELCHIWRAKSTNFRKKYALSPRKKGGGNAVGDTNKSEKHALFHDAVFPEAEPPLRIIMAFAKTPNFSTIFVYKTQQLPQLKSPGFPLK